MKRAKFTDNRKRYRTADESRQPGYLARRLKAYQRLARMQARQTNVQPIVKRKVA